MTKFSRAFWTANLSELFERMAYYAIFIVITLYLSNTLGFNDIEASLISGLFSGGLYFLPMFTGAFADKIGYRKAILIAFTLLTIGYLGLGMLPVMLESAGLVEYGEKTHFTGLETSSLRLLIVPVMVILVIGGSFIKSIISASVARETTSETRARGYSIFYMMVNIGAFTGKCFVDPMRSIVGDEAYIYINFFSATLCFIALLTIFFFFHSANTSGEGKSMAEVFRGLGKVFTNGRLLLLILIVTGFWMIQHQMYATMPKYVIRMAGETAKPGWIANVNPFVVVIFVNIITQLMAKRKALTSMAVGMCPYTSFRTDYGLWKSVRRRYFRYASHNSDDDCRNCRAGTCRMFHISAIYGILLIAGSKRRGGTVSGIQSSSLIPCFSNRFRFVRYSSYGILSGPCTV